jgi:hypothetical protein
VIYSCKNKHAQNYLFGPTLLNMYRLRNSAVRGIAFSDLNQQQIIKVNKYLQIPLRRNQTSKPVVLLTQCLYSTASCVLYTLARGVYRNDR